MTELLYLGYENRVKLSMWYCGLKSAYCSFNYLNSTGCVTTGTIILSTCRKACLNMNLSTTNHTWTLLGLSQCLHNKKQATALVMASPLTCGNHYCVQTIMNMSWPTTACPGMFTVHSLFTCSWVAFKCCKLKCINLITRNNVVWSQWQRRDKSAPLNNIVNC